MGKKTRTKMRMKKRKTYRRHKKYRGGDGEVTTPNDGTSMTDKMQEGLNQANEAIENAKNKVGEESSSVFGSLTSWFNSSSEETPQPQPEMPTVGGKRRRRRRRTRRR